MIALEVKINGKVVTTAGRDDLCVLNTLIDAIGSLDSPNTASSTNNLIQVGVSGVAKKTESTTGTKLNWLLPTTLGLGDEISIRVIETKSADHPVRITKHDHSHVNDQSCWQMARDIYHQHKHEFEK
jgi:hypothetical protein